MKNREINKSIICILSIFMIICCNDNRQVTISKQDVWYDSINSKNKLFSVKLFTTLTFKNIRKIERKDYNNFYIIFRKDTFVLVPEVNFSHKVIYGNSISIDYFSDLYHKEKNVNNDAFIKEIKSCPVKEFGKTESIRKSPEYVIISTESLYTAPPQPKGVKEYQ